MDRRSFLKSGGTAALGVALGGCAPVLAAGRGPRRPLVRLAPVQVSPERVIRTTVGLRPTRDSGFVLRPERFDETTVIHNFGHGGAGMSLSWGTGALAAELALQHPDRSAAVLGCGIVGLTAARQLQRRGFAVTLYAAALPPHTTSNMSWAAFTPTSGLVTRRTPAWDEQFRRAVEISYREHQLLVGRGYGVSWIDSYAPSETPARGRGYGARDGDPLLPPGMEVGAALLSEGEHPFPTRYAWRQPQLSFEPSVYLDALMRDVVAFGGRVFVRALDTPRDLAALPERLVVNCTGLGSRALFGDPELTPVKGQLVVLVPQPEVNYSIGGMLPRRDGIVLGHVQQRGEWSLEVDQAERDRVLRSAAAMFASLRPFRLAEGVLAGG